MRTRVMQRDARQLRDAARSLVAECGSYATMAALFLASEAREAGDAGEAADWARIAGLVSALHGPLRPVVVFPMIAGRA